MRHPARPTPIGRILILVALLSAACAPEEGGPDLRQVLTAEPLELSDWEWGEVAAFDVASDGTLAAYDGIRHIVVIFHPDGASPTVLGGEGEGPGEILDGRAVALDSSTLVLADAHRISRWATSGPFLGSTRSGPAVQDISTGALGTLVKSSLVGRERTFEIRRLDRASGELGEVLVRIDPLAVPDSLDFACTPCELVQLPDSTLLTNVEPDRPIAVAFDLTGDVRGVIEGERRPPVPYTLEEWNDRYERARARGNRFFAAMGIPFQARRRIYDRPPERPKRSRRRRGTLGVDANRQVWTLPSVHADSVPLLDVHDLHGNHLGTVGVDHRLRAISVEGEYLVALTHDALGRSRLLRYVLPDLRPGEAP
jgi:hypothetical protein